MGAEGSEVPCPTCPLLTAACCVEQVNITMVRNLLSSATVCSEEGIPGGGGKSIRDLSLHVPTPNPTPGDIPWPPQRWHLRRSCPRSHW